MKDDTKIRTGHDVDVLELWEIVCGDFHCFKIRISWMFDVDFVLMIEHFNEFTVSLRIDQSIQIIPDLLDGWMESLIDIFSIKMFAESSLIVKVSIVVIFFF